ncbi:MAG: GNAT family protein [Anaerolineae bacterium]
MHKLLLDLPTHLETERLTVRCYQHGDGTLYYDLCQRSKMHLTPFEADNPIHFVNSPDDAEILMRRFILSWAARDAFFFGAWDKSTGAFTAQIYVGVINWSQREFELGYIVDPAQQGKGYVTEAARAVLGWIFRHLNARRVRLACNEANVRSWHVAERLGFKREGLMRQTHDDILLSDGTPSGDYVYGLLRAEFENGA